MKYKCEIASSECQGYADKVVRSIHYCQPCKDFVMAELAKKQEERAKKWQPEEKSCATDAATPPTTPSQTSPKTTGS